MMCCAFVGRRAVVYRTPCTRLPTALAARYMCTKPSGPESPSSPNRTLVSMYHDMLERSPLATKSLTSGVIVAAGDLASQLFFSVSPFDPLRFVRMAALGCGLIGPALHYWYGFLNTRFPKPGVQYVFLRMAIDQTVFALPFIAIFFIALLLLEMRPGEIPTVLSTQWWPTAVANWTIWIPAQLINFWLLPLKYQVLFANCVGLGWNCYLSYVAHKNSETLSPVNMVKASA